MASGLASLLQLSKAETENTKVELASCREQWQQRKAELEQAKENMQAKEKRIEEVRLFLYSLL
jgi:predicted  nucleic acid-binding Zn-ribbon protein